MSLQQELDALRAEFERTAPAGRAALYTAKVEELRATFPKEQALAVGAMAPAFTLPDATGMRVSLADVLARGPAFVIFYRGGWCPYCNLQLRAWQRQLPAIQAAGATLLAISPQMPDASLTTAEKNALAFPVLSDAGNAVARAFGLVYSMPAEIRAALTANGKPLPGFNGDESWELPITASFLIRPDGRVAVADIELDYRRRMDPTAMLAALTETAA